VCLHRACARPLGFIGFKGVAQVRTGWKHAYTRLPRVYVFMCVSVYISVCVCEQGNLLGIVHMCALTFVCTCTHTGLQGAVRVQSHIHTHTCIRAHTHTHIHAHTHTHTHTNMHTCTLTHTHTRTHAHTHAHTHTRVHTHVGLQGAVRQEVGLHPRAGSVHRRRPSEDV
jgi:hypothetical protein